MTPRHPTIRYRCPTASGAPLPGHIVMGEGPRVRRAYRVLDARATRGGLIALGCITWRLTVEPMSAAAGRSEIAAGVPAWGVKWDVRRKGARHVQAAEPVEARDG